MLLMTPPIPTPSPIKNSASSPHPSAMERLARGVCLEQLATRGHSSPDGAMTILFTDIEGSTQLVDRLGDRRWMSLLRTHNRIVRDHLADHEGVEVKHQGDGFMLAFSSSRAALRFAHTRWLEVSCLSAAVYSSSALPKSSSLNAWSPSFLQRAAFSGSGSSGSATLKSCIG